jgi:transcription-repair coupling factor (superfamily II helicase)
MEVEKFETRLPNLSSQAYRIYKNPACNDRVCIFACKNEEAAEEFIDAYVSFPSLLDGEKKEIVFLEFSQVGESSALFKIDYLLKSKKPFAIVTSPKGLELEIPSRNDFEKNVKTITIDEEIPRHHLINLLETLGYERTPYVEFEGEYAVRGSVVDIFCPDEKLPFRLYFYANKVAEIKRFEIETQQTNDTLDKITLLPIGLENSKQTILDWVKNPKVFIEQGLEDGILKTGEDGNDMSFPSSPQILKNISFHSDMKIFEEELKRLKRENVKTIVSCLNKGEAQRIQELLFEHKSVFQPDFRISPLVEGFQDKKNGLAIITSSEIFNRRYTSSSIIKKIENNEGARIRFKDLKSNDYIVHEEYGIGKYLGLKTIYDSPQLPIECLEIEFKNRHKLFVPMYDFKKVQKFIGAQGKAPRLSSLSGRQWNEIKRRVKENAREVAKELLSLQAKHLLAKASTLHKDITIENEFADSFPYQETEDQDKAISEILKDVELVTPMDRLLVGDVGFGKTEVAMRAALRCALNGKQTFFLVPTTVLASQHYRTFSKRLSEFPVSVAMISRFQTKQKQREVLNKLKVGKIDIIIGTHRLLSKDVSLQNIGLCIIDEEHRFGVRQKEKLKKTFAGVHTLYLSATPIPRTLHQSLSSIKQISVIETPPEGRMPISTKIIPYDDKIVVSAIREEIARGGQVYYVHNRVKTLPSRFSFLTKLMPDVRICMAHGQMKGNALDNTMWDFYSRKYDVLLSSTIIESGLDIPEVNTLIVENAHEFGLAQLYQLRGRVGRGKRKGFCYFFYPSFVKKRTQETHERYQLNDKAQKRLDALMEFSDLGSGLRLAMRDLEIRGAGELLGTRQHGFINNVGLNLYCELLSSEIKKAKGESVEPVKKRANIDLKIPAYIPEEYLPDETERLKHYQNMLNAKAKDLEKTIRELEDISGPAPREIHNLADIIRLQHMAGEKGVRSISQTDGFIEIYLLKNSDISQQTVTRLMEGFGRDISFMPSPIGDGMKVKTQNKDPLKLAKLIVSSLRTQ